MQKLFKLSILTLTFVCANYFSILAQNEQRVFNEGDKIFTFGLGFGSESPLSSSLKNSPPNILRKNETIGFTPSVSFDYGLKRIGKFVIGIGGFLSYSQRQASIYNGYGFTIQNQWGNNYSPTDSVLSEPNLKGLKSHTLTAGVRLDLHYAIRRWDFYAGSMVNFQKVITESNAGEILTYQYPKLPLSLPIGSSKTTYVDYGFEQFIVQPYVGLRYFVSPKIALNLEGELYKGRAGISFKF